MVTHQLVLDEERFQRLYALASLGAIAICSTDLLVAANVQGNRVFWDAAQATARILTSARNEEEFEKLDLKVEFGRSLTDLIQLFEGHFDSLDADGSFDPYNSRRFADR